MPQTNPYTILSIGPIYDTLQIADNTRAVWTVSFMFSYLMRETIKELKTKCKDDFIVPNLSSEFEKYLNNGQRVGLFHDRLILKGEHANTVNTAFQNVVGKLAADIVVKVFEESKKYRYVEVDVDADEVKAFIKGYFQSYIAQVDVPSGKNPILELSKYVDGVEHEPALPPHEDKEFLFLFFRLTNLGLLKKIAFKDDAYNINKERCFKSLPEISAWELVKQNSEQWKKTHLCLTIDKVEEHKNNIKDPQSEAEEIIKELEKEFKCSDGKVPCFKPYHKYVAIVHGDGDSFGKYLEKIGSDETKIKGFSDNIFKFITSARDVIRNYGGYPVVGSGEDLLFFAPVINENENIFTLINDIDEKFRDSFDDTTLSMSYGVSITYYKFPLQEALELSSHALWGEAKKAKWSYKTPIKEVNTKNAVHIHIQKHSGQSHSLTLPKDTELYGQFIVLLSQELDSSEALHLPHSLHHSLDRVAKVIDEMPSSSIEPFFENMFNESIHKGKHKEALEATQKILRLLKEDTATKAIHRIYEDNNKKEYIQKASQLIFSILSTIKMLRGDQ